MAAVFPATSVVDDFNRADGPAGASWTGNPDGVVRPEFAIVSNQFDPVAANAWMTYDTITSGAFDEWFVDVPTYTAGSVEIEVGMVEIGAATYDGYAFEYRGATPAWRLQRYNNNTTNLLAIISPAASGISMASGVGIGIRRMANRITGYAYTGGRWREVLTVVDSSPLPYVGGYGGLYSDNASNVFDNFGGGDVPADAVDLHHRPRRRRRHKR